MIKLTKEGKTHSDAKLYNLLHTLPATHNAVNKLIRPIYYHNKILRCPPPLLLSSQTQFVVQSDEFEWNLKWNKLLQPKKEKKDMKTKVRK